MSTEEAAISGFGDAVCEVLALSEDFKRGHGAAVLDGAGLLLDLTVFTRPDHSVKDAILWAWSVVLLRPEATRIVLLSVVPQGVHAVREKDLRAFRDACALFASRSVTLVDWLQTDGDEIRSLAFTEGLDSWGAT